MPHTYLGPADVFIWNDKAYHRGDAIPMSKRDAEHHARNGHRFEDIEFEPPAPANLPVTVDQVEPSEKADTKP